MAKLVEELVAIEDLVFVLDDIENTFQHSCPKWQYIWYRIVGDPQHVYLVAYESREELLRMEKDR